MEYLIAVAVVAAIGGVVAFVLLKKKSPKTPVVIPPREFHPPQDPFVRK